jgi:hypothetical protein
MIKTKIALAAVLFAATSSAAFAQFDPDLANRYPGYAAPAAYGYSASGRLSGLHSATTGTLQSAPVKLQHRPAPALEQRNVALPAPSDGYYDGVNQFNVDRSDRASSPYAGGGS